MKRVFSIVCIPVPALLVVVSLSGLSLAGENEEPDVETCADCHETDTIDGVVIEFGTQLPSSVHEGIECTECHSAITELPHDEELGPIACGECHDDVAETYTRHGRVSVAEDADVPLCQDCHGKHDILPSSDRRSRVSAERMPTICGLCHEDIDLTTRHELTHGPAIAAFKTSVHGRAIAGSRLLAAKCRDCHSISGSAHQIYGANDPESTINHFNIPNTCGNCHSIVEDEYWEGIHGQLVARGDAKAPVCTHCHGEHGIVAPSDPRSPVSPLRVAESTCSPCHESAFLNDAYAVESGDLKSWTDSYHGLKSQAGDVTVANCASCHEAHLILPHTDPKSSIHAENLQTTCGRCHDDISAEVAATRIHEQPAVSESQAANLVKNIYIIIIVLVIGGMIAYVLIDLRKQIRLIFKGKQYRRMNANEVWQHYFLMVTFIVLVVTGFSLRFSESWWAKLLFGFEGGFPLRGTIHRVAGVAFILTSIWHLLYLATDRGRRFIGDMFPNRNDLTQFIQQIAYNLGIKKEPPKFGRFGYVEKAEYWALVWGTVIMVASGLVLWFENSLIRWLPKTVLDVTLVVHYYEAWLATLAILIWHLYSTVYNPKVYPMSPSWIHGRMPLHMFHHEHGGATVSDSEIDPNGAESEDDSAPRSPDTGGRVDHLKHN